MIFAKTVTALFSRIVVLTAAGMMTGCYATDAVLHRAEGRDFARSPDPKVRAAKQPRMKPAPALYVLVPVTVAFDAATFPFQVYIWAQGGAFGLPGSEL